MLWTHEMKNNKQKCRSNGKLTRSPLRQAFCAMTSRAPAATPVDHFHLLSENWGCCREGESKEIFCFARITIWIPKLIHTKIDRRVFAMASAVPQNFTFNINEAKRKLNLWLYSGLWPTLVTATIFTLFTHVFVCGSLYSWAFVLCSWFLWHSEELPNVVSFPLVCNEMCIQPKQWFAGRTRLDMDDTTWHDRFVRFLHMWSTFVVGGFPIVTGQF